MKKSTLIEIVLIVFGISTLLSLLAPLKDLIWLVILSADESSASSNALLRGGIPFSIIWILCIILISYFLIFKNKKIATKIAGKVDEVIAINLSKYDLIQTAFVIIGGICIVWALPEFVTQLVMQIKMKQMDNLSTMMTSNANQIWICLFKIIFGFIVMNYSSNIAQYFIKKEK